MARRTRGIGVEFLRPAHGQDSSNNGIGRRFTEGVVTHVVNAPDQPILTTVPRKLWTADVRDNAPALWLVHRVIGQSVWHLIPAPDFDLDGVTTGQVGNYLGGWMGSGHFVYRHGAFAAITGQDGVQYAALPLHDRREW